MRRHRYVRVFAPALMLAVAVTGTVAPAAAAAPTAAPSAVQAELAGWKKALLSKSQIQSLADMAPGTVSLINTYNTKVGYSKTYQGQSEDTGVLTLAAVEIDKMPPVGFKPAAQQFATLLNLDVETLTDRLLVGTSINNGVKNYVKMVNVGGGYVVTGLYQVPLTSADDAYGASVASKLVTAQTKKLNNAGYGR